MCLQFSGWVNLMLKITIMLARFISLLLHQNKCTRSCFKWSSSHETLFVFLLFQDTNAYLSHHVYFVGYQPTLADIILYLGLYRIFVSTCTCILLNWSHTYLCLDMKDFNCLHKEERHRRYSVVVFM